MKDKINIAIDGLSGCGKSTLAKGLARHYGIIYVDTGALYRTVGLRIQQLEINHSDTESIIAALPNVDISIRLNNGGAEVLLDGKPVGDEIRTPTSSLYASEISKIPEVRAFLLETQKKLARENSCVMDGRDIGTVIMPDADVKIYLSAKDDERAKRRYDELVAKGLGVELSAIKSAIVSRDDNDSKRAVAPAVAAPDAILLDNSGITKEETLAAAIAIIDKAVGKMSFYHKAVTVLRPLVKFFFRVTVIGRENEPDEPYIMCANHSSFIDSILCACTLKHELRLVARNTLARFKILDYIFRKARVITIDREGVDLSSMRTIISASKSGECVGIFPQGTRMRQVEPKPEQAMSGIGLIASRTNVKMLPVSIITKRRMPGFFRKTYLVIGKPITPEEYLGDGERSKKEISEFIFERVCKPFDTPFKELKNL